MLNQSTITGTRIVEGAVIATVNGPSVAVVRGDRADSQPKHLGKRLHLRRLSARLHERRFGALGMGHASAACASYSAPASAGESWRMRMPVARSGSQVAPATSELPASAWAALVIARAV